MTINDAGSFSAMFNSFSVGISNAIGTIASLINNGITVSKCDESLHIIDTIYQTSNPPSLNDPINGFLACSNWVHNNVNHYITKDLSANCILVNHALALSTCIQYLGIVNDEL